MRHYPNTPMPDLPSTVVPVEWVHILLPGEAFSPMELCFPELIAPLAKPRGIPKGAKAAHFPIQLRTVIPDRPPLALAQLCVEAIGEPCDFDFSWGPDRLTVAFAIAQGAVMSRANDLAASAQQNHTELPSPLLSVFLEDCRREIEAKLTGAAEAIGKATGQQPATPEHLFPFDETDPDAATSAFLALAVTSWRELRNVLTLPVINSLSK